MAAAPACCRSFSPSSPRSSWSRATASAAVRMTPDGPALAFDVEIRAGGHAVRAQATMREPGTLVVFGRSGVGKTLTLRALAGLERPVAGTIRQRGRTLYDGAA